jgi:hypothetical protein
MEREEKILNKAKELMEQLKPLTYRERDMVLVFLKHLIDIDTWIDTPHNNRGRGASNNLIK